jgi:hypothetical protein
MDRLDRRRDGVAGTSNSDVVGDAWRHHGPAALRFAVALVGPHDAYDITTSAFLRVARQENWADFEHLDRYLYRAVRNDVSAQEMARSALTKTRG